MLHGRWVRPRGQGPYLTDGFAKPLSVDASSIAHIPGVKVIQVGDFVGVVAPKEYAAIQAAQQLKVTWADSPILPGSASRIEQLRAADSAGQIPRRIVSNVGNYDAAFAAAAKTLSASFYASDRGHNPIGPGCAIADYVPGTGGGADSDHGLLEHPERRELRPGSRDDVRPAALERARRLLRGLELVRQRLARVRHRRGRGAHVTRGEGAGAAAADALGRAGLDALRPGVPDRPRRAGSTPRATSSPTRRRRPRSRAPRCSPRASSRSGSSRRRSAAARRTPRTLRRSTRSRSSTSGTSGYQVIGKTITQSLGVFQSGTLRAPSGPQTSFASEQFIDMLAELAGMDPLAFRAAEPPHRRAVPALGDRASDGRRRAPATSRTSPRRSPQPGNTVTGWGMAIGTHNASYAGTVAHVQVDKKTGKVSVPGPLGGAGLGPDGQPGSDREPDVRAT